MIDPIERGKIITTQLDELAEIYKTVKHVMLLVEYYNEKKGIIASPMNELRSSLDHIMRAMYCDDTSSLGDEMKSAKKHIYRAAYDACEVIILDRLEYIENLKNYASFSAIEELCPKYSSETLPYLNDIKIKLVDVRSIPDTKERISEYEEMIDRLITITKNLESIMPTLEKIREKKNTSSIFSTTSLSIIFGTILFVVAIINVYDATIPILIQSIIGGVVATAIYIYSIKEKGRKSHDK